jgi:hypothetical protein
MVLFAPADISLGDDLSGAERIRPEVLQEWCIQWTDEIRYFGPGLGTKSPGTRGRAIRLSLQRGHRGSTDSFHAYRRPPSCHRFLFRVIGSHQVFDLSNLLKPTLVELPFPAQPKGFGTTARPGWNTFENETGAFLAETGSDLRPSPRVRHTYRFDANQGFIVVRVELRQDGVGEWTTLWDAPLWSFPAKSK